MLILAYILLIEVSTSLKHQTNFLLMACTTFSEYIYGWVNEGKKRQTKNLMVPNGFHLNMIWTMVWWITTLELSLLDSLSEFWFFSGEISYLFDNYYGLLNIVAERAVRGWRCPNVSSTTCKPRKYFSINKFSIRNFFFLSSMNWQNCCYRCSTSFFLYKIPAPRIRLPPPAMTLIKNGF